MRGNTHNGNDKECRHGGIYPAQARSLACASRNAVRKPSSITG